MLQLYKMAFRNLGRNRRRSFFSALALAIWMTLILLMAAVITGEMRDGMNLSIKLQTGHLQVQSKTYDQTKNSLAWEDLVANPAQVAAQIAALPPVQVATPRLYASAIIEMSDRSIGVQVYGVDPSSAANAPFREGLVGGQFLAEDDREGVLIGQSLADKLSLKTGDQVNLLVNTANGEVSEQPFVIRGIYTTHTPGYDESTLLMPLSKAQAITGDENHASAVFVLLKDQDQTAAVAAALKSDQYQIKTWQQMNNFMLQYEQLANSYLWMLYLIVLVITATVIINTLIMAVFERTREIGILAAMGVKPGNITLLFLLEGALMGLAGAAVGVVLGLGLNLMLMGVGFDFSQFASMSTYTALLTGKIYPTLGLEKIGLRLAVIIIISVLSAYYPARKAAEVEPAQALHYV
jgi:ABC-type lipoprotein release transport system permease subunit